MESLNLQLEQMQLTSYLYPETMALKKSMSDVQEVVTSLPDITETVRKTYRLVQSLGQSREGM